MEFIKLREDRYLIKDSNGLIVSNEEKLKLEKKELKILLKTCKQVFLKL